MDDLSRFFERNAGRFGTSGQTLYVNPPATASLLAATRAERGPGLFFQDYSAWRNWPQPLPRTAFGPFPSATPAQEIVLALPREKDLLGAWLDWSASILDSAGQFWLAGENRAGIKSAEKWLAARFQKIAKVDSARHCALFHATRALATPPFSLDRYFNHRSIEIGGREFVLCSAPGVFSHGDVDEGTRLLLECVQAMKFAGRALDFGCGSGIIATFLALTNQDLKPTLVDSNALALAASERTLDLNQVIGEVVASDGLSDVTGTFDLVITNPPFHRGIHTDTGMSMAMLDPVRNFLKPGGQLIMVVNRHLPYSAWMRELFGHCDALARTNRFQVLRASRPS